MNTETWTDCYGKTYPVKTFTLPHRPALLLIGMHSTTLHLDDGTKLSCPGGPETIFRVEKAPQLPCAQRLDEDQFNGCQFLDARPMGLNGDEDKIKEFVDANPKVDVRLAANAIRRTPIPPDDHPLRMIGSVLGLDGNIAATEEAKSKGVAGPLDFVSTMKYLSLWRAAGAVTGTMEGRKLIPC